MKLPKKIIAARMYVLPIILFCCFVFSVIAYNFFGNFVGYMELTKPPIASAKTIEYPVLNTTIAPTISAESALVMDDTSKVIIYEKNPDLRFSPASTTKLMTALTALSYFHLTDVLTIRSRNIIPIVIGFIPGQQISFFDLLKGMLIPSGNDAAIAIAENFPGGKDMFITKMNENAKKFRLYNTHFGDPVGLTDDITYTTVTDLARLASIVTQNPTIANIVATPFAIITTSDGKFTYPLKNTNDLLGIDGINGIKTGTTEEAKEVFVSSLVRNNHKFIIIVMRSDDRFADTRILINAIVDNVTFEPVNL